MIILCVLYVQCQLFCTQRTYCDFVVWTKKDVHIERIYPDNVFWLNHIQQVDHFFQVGILPELVGKFYSRPSAMDPSPPVSSSSKASSEAACEEVAATYKLLLLP